MAQLKGTPMRRTLISGLTLVFVFGIFVALLLVPTRVSAQLANHVLPNTIDSQLQVISVSTTKIEPAVVTATLGSTVEWRNLTTVTLMLRSSQIHLTFVPLVSRVHE